MMGVAGARLPVSGCRASRAAAALLLVSGSALISIADSRQVLAQQLNANNPYLTFQNQVRTTPTGKSIVAKTAPSAQMLVQANQIRYDYHTLPVCAIGNVEIYYNSTSIEADKVIYDQRKKRLPAEGKLGMPEADGKVSYGELFDLSVGYRDASIDSLPVESAEQTRLAAARA